MRVVVTTESRLIRTADGRVWTDHGPNYAIWRRYLSAFDEVRVVARVLDQASLPDGATRVDGAQVEVCPLPHYIGPQKYLWNRRTIGKAIAAASSDVDGVILRVPSPIGSLMAAMRERHGLTYALEVVGDPHDVFAPGVVRHPLRPLLRRRFAARLRHECRSAIAAAYVTEAYLQSKYPIAPTAPSAAISSIDLPAAAFCPRPRDPARRGQQAPTLISVGSLEQLYKGVDTLIKAVGNLAASGTRVHLVHVGGGRFLSRLEALAARCGVADLVTFTGWLPPGDPVRERLDRAELFVMPSQTEGLPRALIEAMARGLPAVGTRVGGIPELLAEEDLVSPNDPSALASAIRPFLTNPQRAADASARNLARAADFSRELLDSRRNAFYKAVRQATEDRLPLRSAG